MNFCPENVVCFFNFYICCIYWTALQTTFDHGSSKLYYNSDQTAPKGTFASALEVLIKKIEILLFNNHDVI